MRSTIALSLIFAASALAAPWGPWGGDQGPADHCYGGEDDNCESKSANVASARPTASKDATYSAHSTASVSSVSPTSTLQAIQLAAQGTLPDGPLPTVSVTTQNILQVVATVELYEVAFFTELIANVTAEKDGYKVEHKDVVLRDLKAIIAQEQLHAIGANALLSIAGHAQIVPCQYDFPVSNFKQALAFISTQTDIVLGTIQEILSAVSADGDSALIGLFASILGQEGEQNGWFRARQQLIPSALPFLTASSGGFAYTALNQRGIIPGTCPNASVIAAAGVPIFKPLILDTYVQAGTTEIDFSITGALPSNTSVVYINQQNTPKTVKITDIKVVGGKTSFKAPFPYYQFEMNGFTIAAVVQGTGNFTTAGAVAASTLYGPGLIEIN